MEARNSPEDENDYTELEHGGKRRKVEYGALEPTTPSTTATSYLRSTGDLTPRIDPDGAPTLPKNTAMTVSEVQPEMRAPVKMFRGEPSESVSSDLSSASAATTDNKVPEHSYDTKEALQERAIEGGTNPRSSPSFSLSQVPPAPPSTPASEGKSGLSFSFDGIGEAVGPPALGASTPLAPMLVGAGSYVNNTDKLAALQKGQREWLEGDATPAPRKAAASGTAAGAATPKPPRLSQNAPLPEDFSDWAVGDRYDLVRILGRGSYGEVAQAIDLTKNSTIGSEEAYVAIKRIRSPFDQQVDAVRLYREIHILRRMKDGGENNMRSSTKHDNHHDCIIRLLDVIQPPTDDLDDFHDLYLVFEYVDTDLYKLIMSPQYLTTEHIQTFLYQMLAGLKYIHSFSVIHRDLKPANILLNEDCSLKICDFGLARIVDSHAISLSRKGEATSSIVDIKPAAKSSSNVTDKPPVPMELTRQLTKHVVTRWYRAPELILIQAYTSAVDIWSIGCIFAELLSMQEGNVPSYQDRKPLFPGGTCFPLSGEGDSIKADERLDQLSVIFSIIGTPSEDDIDASGKANEYINSLPKMKGKPLESIYPAADPVAIDLLKKMLHFNPTKRVTAEEALEHEFFKGVRRKELERTADGPLKGPGFLDAESIDLGLLKRQTYEEVLWYRDRGVESKASRVV